MEQYLRRTVLSSLTDEIGLRLAVWVGATMWFVWLWGLGMPALLAGMALNLMGQMALTRYRRRKVELREKALRQRIGGEMLLEDMLLMPRRKAHLQAAVLLGYRYPLVILQVEDAGVLCRYQEKRLMIAFAGHAEEEACSSGDVLAAQQACLRLTAEKCVLCLNGECPARVKAFAERMPVPVSFIGREQMLALAGQASPATDEQLLMLKKRKTRFTPGKSMLRMLLHRGKAGRYMFYGVAMLVIQILTGWRWYAFMGLTLVCMAVGCVCHHREDALL